MQGQPRLFLSAIALVLFAAVGVTPNSPAKADDDEKGGIVGSWIGTVTVDTPSGTPLFAFADLISINRGGTLTGTNGNAHFSQMPFLPPVDRVDASDFFGSWEPISDANKFAATVAFSWSQEPPGSGRYCRLVPRYDVFPWSYPRTEYRRGYPSGRGDTPTHQERPHLYRPVDPSIYES
jgi:hypothetical protein